MELEAVDETPCPDRCPGFHALESQEVADVTTLACWTMRVSTKPRYH